MMSQTQTIESLRAGYREYDPSRTNADGTPCTSLLNRAKAAWKLLRGQPTMFGLHLTCKPGMPPMHFNEQTQTLSFDPMRLIATNNLQIVGCYFEGIEET